MQFSFRLLNHRLSFGLQPQDSGWYTSFANLQPLCANGIRLHIWRLYWCYTWPYRPASSPQTSARLCRMLKGNLALWISFTIGGELRASMLHGQYWLAAMLCVALFAVVVRFDGWLIQESDCGGRA